MTSLAGSNLQSQNCVTCHKSVKRKPGKLLYQRFVINYTKDSEETALEFHDVNSYYMLMYLILLRKQRDNKFIWNKTTQNIVELNYKIKT